jgi:hypothetical protein
MYFLCPPLEEAASFKRCSQTYLQLLSFGVKKPVSFSYLSHCGWHSPVARPPNSFYLSGEVVEC